MSDEVNGAPDGDVWHCPGCDNWQLEIRREVLNELIVIVPDGATGGFSMDFTAVHEAIDEALEDHMADCPPLAELHAEAMREAAEAENSPS